MDITIYDHTPLNIHLCKTIGGYAIFKPQPFVKELFETTEHIRTKVNCVLIGDWIYVFGQSKSKGNNKWLLLQLVG
jgi:hypothetical protein